MESPTSYHHQSVNMLSLLPLPLPLLLLLVGRQATNEHKRRTLRVFFLLRHTLSAFKCHRFKVFGRCKITGFIDFFAAFIQHIPRSLCTSHTIYLHNVQSIILRAFFSLSCLFSSFFRSAAPQIFIHKNVWTFNTKCIYHLQLQFTINI